MNDRQRFLAIMDFKSVDRVPNFELGAWGQTVDRWYSEGMPRDAAYWDWFEGEPFFRIERRGFAHVGIGMVPPFEYGVLEESERYLVARHSNGIVTRLSTCSLESPGASVWISTSGGANSGNTSSGEVGTTRMPTIISTMASATTTTRRRSDMDTIQFMSASPRSSLSSSELGSEEFFGAIDDDLRAY